MTMKKILYTALVFIITMSGFAQKLKEAKADKQYDKFAYVDAIKTYERLFEKGYKSQEMLQKLGNAYYFNADLEKANKWYTELFALTQDVEPEYYYRYSQSLKSVKDYKKADEMLAKFNQKNGNDLRAKLAASQTDYLARIKKNSGRYTLENAGINSDKSDYGSAFFNNKVVFASARDTGGLAGRKHSWTNESFTNLYAADMGEEGALSSEERFGSKLNSKFHESTPVFTKDGKTVYFTRNNFLDGKKGKDAQKTTLLKLYKATLEGDTWKDVKELPFNSNDYSVAHPALSPDERTLYFASNMPGTLGQSDLFKVSINGDDTYGTPTNLGNVINTEGRETFPFVSNEGELYFATDGHPGLGGLDIFVAKAEKDGSYKEALNVGEPLNSSKDDFGFLIDNKTRIGYVTSNRDGGQGSDDIYRFKETERIEYNCEQFLRNHFTIPIEQFNLHPIFSKGYEGIDISPYLSTRSSSVQIIPIFKSEQKAVPWPMLNQDPIINQTHAIRKRVATLSKSIPLKGGYKPLFYIVGQLFLNRWITQKTHQLILKQLREHELMK